MMLRTLNMLLFLVNYIKVVAVNTADMTMLTAEQVVLINVVIFTNRFVQVVEIIILVIHVMVFQHIQTQEHGPSIMAVITVLNGFVIMPFLNSLLACHLQLLIFRHLRYV